MSEKLNVLVRASLMTREVGFKKKMGDEAVDPDEVAVGRGEVQSWARVAGGGTCDLGPPPATYMVVHVHDVQAHAPHDFAVSPKGGLGEELDCSDGSYLIKV